MCRDVVGCIAFASHIHFIFYCMHLNSRDVKEGCNLKIFRWVAGWRPADLLLTLQLTARIIFHSEFSGSLSSTVSCFSCFKLALNNCGSQQVRAFCFLLLPWVRRRAGSCAGCSDVQLVLWVCSLGFGLIKYSLLTSKQEIKARAAQTRGGRLQCSWQTGGLKEAKRVKRFARSQWSQRGGGGWGVAFVVTTANI